MVKPLVVPLVAILILVAARGLIAAAPRHRAKYDDRRTNRNRMEECNRLLFGHSDAAMGSRITREVTGMKTDAGCELHKISHRRINKPGPGRRRHIYVGVRYDRPVPAVNDATVYAGEMV